MEDGQQARLGGAAAMVATWSTSYTSQPLHTDVPELHGTDNAGQSGHAGHSYGQMPSLPQQSSSPGGLSDLNSTAKGILIGLLSAFGSAIVIAVVLSIIYFFRYTSRGRIFLDRIGRPGEYDDEQAFLREEEEALEEMDDLQRAEYLRAKAFVTVNAPESLQTDISLSQFLAIQEKGVSAWEFEPELEIANCFVEQRTEIEFFDSECSVQSNLPIPKQNEVYYWEAKVYDKPESTLISVGVTTKPYPMFRLPGWHRYSLAYTSLGQRRYNQPFSGTPYGPLYEQGDVIGCGYRPRTGTIFFTRNGKKLDDVAHGLKSQNFFPTVGASGPCHVQVNFGQMGFVFIEANVKKWGLAPMTGSLAPPPPYGSEQGSILLEGGQAGVREGQGYLAGHARMSSAQLRLAWGARSPGPIRSPTDISLAALSPDREREDGVGEGGSAPEAAAGNQYGGYQQNIAAVQLSHPSSSGRRRDVTPQPKQQAQQHQHQQRPQGLNIDTHPPYQDAESPPPDYESNGEESDGSGSDDPSGLGTTPRPAARALRQGGPPIPSYEAAVAERPRESSRERLLPSRHEHTDDDLS